MKSLRLAGILLLAVAGCSDVNPPAKTTATTHLTSPMKTDQDSAEPADQGHRASNPTQPIEQKNPTDDAISTRIKKGLMDSPMAANLGNVKISTRDGKVTLTGLVKTAEEKQQVEEIAQSAAGDANVISQVEVEQ